MNKKREAFAGIGLGMLLGVIIGLSISQVTGIILGALTSLLAAFFGLRDKKSDDQSKPIIICYFGASCFIFIMLGIYIRTHQLLSPSLASQTEKLKEVGFNQNEIKQILLAKEFGLMVSDWKFSAEAKDKSDKTILMTGEDGLELCSGINHESSLNEIIQTFDRSGKKYNEAERQLRSIINDTTQLKSTLLILKSVLCKE
jgi:hypothetical protein